MSPGQITVGDRDRTYTTTVPADLPAGAPLVVALHGSHQTGAKLADFSGHTFDRLAEREGVVVVYPDGVDGMWNDARTVVVSRAKREGVDDVAFVLALVDAMVERYAVDPARVAVAGFSNGGQLALRLLHEVPGRFRGFALFGTTQPTPDNFSVEDAHAPARVVLVHGTKDPIVPYAGGMASLFGFRPRGEGLSAEATAAYVAARNGIGSTPTHEDVPHRPESGRTSVRATHYRQDGREPVSLYTVEGGGHAVPNRDGQGLHLMGRATRDIDAGELVWTLLEQE